MLSVKFYTKNLIKNYENNHQETENHLSNYIVKNGQKFVDIILLLIPTDVKTIFQHKNQTVKLRQYSGSDADKLKSPVVILEDKAKRISLFSHPGR
jgi:hypothetical protein